MPKSVVLFAVGERVKVKAGTFAGLTGEVSAQYQVGSGGAENFRVHFDTHEREFEVEVPGFGKQKLKKLINPPEEKGKEAAHSKFRAYSDEHAYHVFGADELLAL